MAVLGAGVIGVDAVFAVVVGVGMVGAVV